MDGGALLGFGTYGCVFDRPLRVLSTLDGKCKSLDTTKKTVGKISEASDVANEVEAAKIISQIPKHELYFSVLDLKNVNQPCDKNKQVDKPGIEECPIVKRVPMARMLHFIMPYSGVGLSKFLNIHIQNKRQIPFEKTITHLLEAAALLVLNSFVHFDIHSENVLFDDKTSMPRIIDFGFGLSVKDIRNETLDTRWKVYTPDYPTEAPEITAIHGLRHKTPLNTAIHDIIHGKHPIKMSQFILGIKMDQQYTSLRNFMNNSKSIMESDWVSFFKYYWPGFDAWGIGAVILKFYSFVSQIPTYTKEESWKEVSEKTKYILRGLLRASPLERIDCVEALYIFQPESDIFKSERALTWIQEKGAFRKPLST